MASSSDSLNPAWWTGYFTVAATTKRLTGDKIILPQSALQSLLDSTPRNLEEQGDIHALAPATRSWGAPSYASRQNSLPQLPQPLTFRLVNPTNGRTVYAGVREFSAQENEVLLSDFLRQALDLGPAPLQANSRALTPDGEVDVPMSDVMANLGQGVRITVQAKQLPKGTYVRIRPLEAGYDIRDWRSLLEKYMRDNYTTLTVNTVLGVPGDNHEKLSFLVDKLEPDVEGDCIVDTDLVVDVEALNEDQARETLKQQRDKSKRGPATAEGSSAGGYIELDQQVSGQVLPGEYVDYKLKSWNKSDNLEIMVATGDEEAMVDVLANPMSARQQAKPRDDEHVFADMSSRPNKRLKLNHTNVDVAAAEAIAISIHGFRAPGAAPAPGPTSYMLSVKPIRVESEEQPPTVAFDEVICKNCRQVVPKHNLALHETFCYRNNVHCPKCDSIIRKSDWKSHWHCPHDSFYGASASSQARHNALFHPDSTMACPACSYRGRSLPELAHHRTTTCPGKPILCQFCNLIVPQQSLEEGDPEFNDPAVLLSEMTPHEYAEGARTTECHICKKVIRLRDMAVHLKLHDHERIGRQRPTICANAICGRSIRASDEFKVATEQLGLCNECFGPLYHTTLDPDWKALRRRVERRLLQQMVTGCGKAHCSNVEWCKTAKKNQTGEVKAIPTKEVMAILKPRLDALIEAKNMSHTRLTFCVDEVSQKRRIMAGTMGELSNWEYELEWYIKALEETKGMDDPVDKATEWLGYSAPKKGELMMR